MWENEGNISSSTTTLSAFYDLWSSPVRVNSNLSKDDYNWAPQVSADHHGNLMAVWENHAREIDPNHPGLYRSKEGEIYISFSNDSGQTWNDMELLTFDTNSPNADDQFPALVYHPSDKNSTWSVFFESRNRDFAESNIYRSLVSITIPGDSIIGILDPPGVIRKPIIDLDKIELSK